LRYIIEKYTPNRQILQEAIWFFSKISGIFLENPVAKRAKGDYNGLVFPLWGKNLDLRQK
jgi:hypothetical protein